MRKQIICATGITLLIGGLCALFYGYAAMSHYPTVEVFGTLMRSQSLMVDGGLAAAIGAGLAVFGMMMRPSA